MANCFAADCSFSAKKNTKLYNQGQWRFVQIFKTSKVSTSGDGIESPFKISALKDFKNELIYNVAPAEGQLPSLELKNIDKGTLASYSISLPIAVSKGLISGETFQESTHDLNGKAQFQPQHASLFILANKPLRVNELNVESFVRHSPLKGEPMLEIGAITLEIKRFATSLPQDHQFIVFIVYDKMSEIYDTQKFKKYSFGPHIWIKIREPFFTPEEIKAGVQNFKRIEPQSFVSQPAVAQPNPQQPNIATEIPAQATTAQGIADPATVLKIIETSPVQPSIEIQNVVDPADQTVVAAAPSTFLGFQVESMMAKAGIVSAIVLGIVLLFFGIFKLYQKFSNKNPSL